MVAFSANMIPSDVNTVEGLAAWCCTVLNNLHFQMEVAEAPNVIEKVAVSQVFPVNNNGTYQWRYVGRISLLLNADYQKAFKVWHHVQPLSNATLPGDFTSP